MFINMVLPSVHFNNMLSSEARGCGQWWGLGLSQCGSSCLWVLLDWHCTEKVQYTLADISFSKPLILREIFFFFFSFLDPSGFLSSFPLENLPRIHQYFAQESACERYLLQQGTMGQAHPQLPQSRWIFCCCILTFLGETASHSGSIRRAATIHCRIWINKTLFPIHRYSTTMEFSRIEQIVMTKFLHSWQTSTNEGDNYWDELVWGEGANLGSMYLTEQSHGPRDRLAGGFSRNWGGLLKQSDQ